MKPKVKITITEARQLQEICDELLERLIDLNSFCTMTKKDREENEALISKATKFAPNELKTFR